MDQEQVGIKTPEFVSLRFQLAGLGSRTAAFLIDQFLLMVVNILILIVLLIIFVGQPDLFLFLNVNSYVLAFTIIGLFIINWGYFFAYEYFSGGRTVGKRVIGIRVIQDNGHSLTILSSLIRNLLRIIDSLPANYFLGLIMIFFHSKHKRLGDVVAGTIVVYERKAKRKKKFTPLEKEIENKGLTKDDLAIDDWVLKSLEMKDWKLIKTYSNRLVQLPLNERYELTQKVANILLPKLGIDMSRKSNLDLENSLLILYLKLREEWEYEL